jgi:5-formyltetrahydrofolate cyclo-ligase
MSDAKALLRAEVLERRKKAHARQSQDSLAGAGGAEAALAHHGLSFLPLRPPAGALIAGFAAIRDEINPHALLHRLQDEGYALALPVMQGKGQRLLFRAYEPGDPLVKAVWGIPEPAPGKAVIEPDIVLAPLVAFDARGYRLGYGGGFYDRTLTALRAKKPILAIGIAYSEQQVDAVPHEPYDQKLDWVLTPSGAIRCGGT